MNLPRITIVTPSFNQAKYLPKTIESILSQNYPNLEYMIIDGGSTDGSVDIIKKYESHLSYWCSEKDEGQSDAIEKGMERSTGDLLNWINSDDLLFPGALGRIADAWMKRPQTDLVVGSQAFCDRNGRIFRISCPPSRASFSIKNWIPIGQQSTFFSRDAYRRVGGVLKELHAIMDQDLYYRILKSGGNLFTINGLVGMIRYHAEAKTHCRKDLWEDEIPRFMSKHGISPKSQFLAKCWMRLARCIDGSYWQSWKMTQKFRGMTLDEVG
jgi:glycosyltransferase involved in cell wall biosynthesis